MSIFGAKSVNEPAAPAGGLSIISAGMTVRGDIDSNGTVKVEGEVDGHIRAASQVLVAKGGLVHGDIEAREAIVGGAVQGAIRAEDRVEIQAGAAVQGDVTTRRIAVAEGGSLNGQIRMGDAALEAKAGTGGKTEGRGAATGPAAASAVRPSVPVARVAVPPRTSSTGF